MFDCRGGELEAVVDEAEAAGVWTAVNTAVSIGTARVVLDQCGRFPKNLKAAVGISPFDTVEAADNWENELKELLAGHRSLITAIGEIGLDDTNPRYPSIEIQMPFFKRQLEIAIDAGLPAIVHSRGIEKKTAEICRETGVSKAVFHCFTGDRGSMEYIIESGYYISISGIITYKSSHLRDIIQHIPVDRLLLESDAPYLSPTPQRGKKNKPAFIIHTAREISELLGTSERELSDTLKKNAAAALGF